MIKFACYIPRMSEKHFLQTQKLKNNLKTNMVGGGMLIANVFIDVDVSSQISHVLGQH